MADKDSKGKDNGVIEQLKKHIEGGNGNGKGKNLPPVNEKPWLDSRNDYQEKALERLSELPSRISERVTDYNFDLDAEEVIKQIPIDSGGKSKYNRQNVQQIYDIISATGLEKMVFDEYDIIALNTLTKWKRRYPDFLWLVLKAKENFRLQQWEVNPDLRVKAVSALRRALEGKRRERWNIVMQDEEGKKSFKSSERKAPTPKWVIELVLGLRENETDGGGKNQITELNLE